MKFAKAVKQAVRLAGKEGALAGIQLFPASGAFPPALMSSDGLVTGVWTLDSDFDVPYVFVDSKSLGRAVAAIKGNCLLAPKADSLVVQADNWSCEVPSAGPRHPHARPVPNPQYKALLSFKLILSVARCAAIDSDRPNLEYVSIQGEQIEATDEFRTGRAVLDEDTGIHGLVHGRAFRAWPPGLVEIGQEDGVCYFRIGHELRCVPIGQMWQPKTRSFPAGSFPVRYILSRGESSAILKQLMASVQAKTIFLSASSEGLVVGANEGPDGHPNGTSAYLTKSGAVEGGDQMHKPIGVHVNGAYLVDAIKAAPLDEVHLYLGHETPALWLRSGGWAEIFGCMRIQRR